LAKGSPKAPDNDMLRIEKRVIDMELVIGELKDSIQKMDVSAVPEMRQEVEDTKDLIMVEQAAIIELKKMLEQREKPVSEDFDKKISEIEANAVSKSDFDSRIETIEKEVKEHTVPAEIENIYNKISKLESSLAASKSDREGISREVEDRLKELSPRDMGQRQQPVDYDMLVAKIGAGKENLEKLSRDKLDLELKIAEIGKKLEILERDVEGSPEKKFMHELKRNRQELVSVNSRIDSIERVARELMADSRKFEKEIGKFESLEKISLLGRTVEDKLEKTQFIEDEVKRLTSRIQNIYDEIDSRLDKLRGLEKKYSGDIPALVKIVEANRRQFGEMENKMGELRKNIYPLINQGLRPINKRADFIEKKLKETRTSEIGKILTDVTMRMSVIEERIKYLERSDESKLAEFRTAVREKLGDINAQPAMDHQFKEVINRMIFLESRLMAIEKMMQERASELPIIIE
jgi:predicted  nucleic acid-binding Zn-ribbon protein